jgi:hypothetical protein
MTGNIQHRISNIQQPFTFPNRVSVNHSRLETLAFSPNSEVEGWTKEVGTGALRCPRPRRAVGMNCAKSHVRLYSFRAYYGARTAQRAIPTNFGVRVQPFPSACVSQNASQV